MAYVAGSHTGVSKPIGISGNSTDARTRYYDSILFKYRDYVSTAEVLAYLTTAANRTGGFPILVNSTGTLSNGVITGGERVEYWFKNGMTDGDLVVKSSGGSLTIDATPTNGSTNAVSSDGVFDALAGKQATLVSGTNIKTINGSTVLGSGDITISAGGSAASDEIIGTIYDKSSNWTNLSDFASGTNAAVSSGNIAITGSASLELPQRQLKEKFKTTSKFTVSVKDSGSGVVSLGHFSTNTWYGGSNFDAYATFDKSTGSDSGKIKIYGYSGSNTLFATSKALTFSQGDRIVFSFELFVDKIYAQVYNATSKQDIITVSHCYSIAGGGINTGRIGFKNSASNVILESLSVSSTEFKYPDVLIVGDSKTSGAGATKYGERFASLIQEYIPKIVISGGPSDRVSNAFSRQAELNQYRPKVVLMFIGRNSVASGEAYTADYQALVSGFEANGALVLHSNGLYETSESHASFQSFLNATYSGKIIDTWSATSAVNGTVDTDGVHQSVLGHRLTLLAVLDSLKINTGQKSWLLDVKQPEEITIKPIAENYTITGVDNNSLLVFSSGNLTVPPSNVGFFKKGFQILVKQKTSTVVNFIPGSNVLLQNQSNFTKTKGIYSIASLVYEGKEGINDVWALTGELEG